MLTRLLNRWRFARAERAFARGALSRARARYAALAECCSEFAPKATLKLDWLAAWQNGIASSWPRYPGAVFDDPPPAEVQSPGPVRVVDPRQPMELATRLGLKRWTPASNPWPPLDRPLLIWFNFKHSLGGELLAARLVHLLRTRHAGQLVLACHPRVAELLRRAFPAEMVVTVDDDLAEVVDFGGTYVLARDLLELLVDAPGDLRVVAAHRIELGPTMVPTQIPTEARRSGTIRGPEDTPASKAIPGPDAALSPRVALSWKTTNRSQGRYRNPPLRELGRWMARHPHVIWYVAQHGSIESDLRVLRRCVPEAQWCLDAIDPTADLRTLGAQLKHMDAVVTIDNTLLHLAGSLGIPTLAMISMPAYWAWPAEGRHSLWYDSVAMIRQRRPADWSAVWRELDRELARATASDHGRAAGPGSA